MMNQEDIFNKIGQILNELNDQYQYLAQNKEELNELELELFLANASFLTDHVHIVRKLNKKTEQKILPEHAGHSTENHIGTNEPTVVQQMQPGVQEEKIEQEPIIPVKLVEEPIIDTSRPKLDDDIFKLDKEPANFEFILNEKPGSDKFEFEEKSVGDIFDRPLSKEEEQIIAQKQKLRELDSLESELPEEDEIGPEPFLVSETDEEIPITQPTAETSAIIEIPYSSPVKEIEPESVPEAIKPAENPVKPAPVHSSFSAPAPAVEQPASKPTLNDLLSANSNPKSGSTGNSRGEITDLKQAISLNDRMRYIKDLFNGYNLAYAEAIDLLNKMPDFKTADNFLKQNYAVKNNWDSKQETAEQFYDLLNQRFPAK